MKGEQLGDVNDKRAEPQQVAELRLNQTILALQMENYMAEVERLKIEVVPLVEEHLETLNTLLAASEWMGAAQRVRDAAVTMHWEWGSNGHDPCDKCDAVEADFLAAVVALDEMRYPELGNASAPNSAEAVPEDSSPGGLNGV